MAKPARPTPMPVLMGQELHGGYAAGLQGRLNKNAVRGLATRRKIIEATIECLYAFGYYATSTVLVTKQAKVSRGSMLNQFPTKADLMIAVAEHIAEGRAAAHVAGMASATSYRDKYERLVPILWKELRDPSGVARIELLLASRSDPELSGKFAPLNEILEKAHRRVVWALLKELGVADRDISDALVHLYSAALRGLSIDLLFEGREQTIENSVAMLQSFLQSLLDHHDYHVKMMKPSTAKPRVRLAATRDTPER